MDEVEIGEMRAELRQVQKDVADIKAHVAQMRDMLAAARGAQRAILVLGGIAASLASGAAWLWGFLRGSA